MNELEFLRDTRSFNNRLILEEYKHEGLKATYSHGIAMVSQKVNLKGLKVLHATKLSDGTIIPRGSVAYIREELLHSAAWAKKVFESDLLGQNKFLIVDLQYVDVIVPPELADTPF